MISQIPAQISSLQTNVIATVRRENQPSVGDSAYAQQRDQQKEAFTLNPTPREMPAGGNDNFAAATIHLASVSENQQAASGSKTAYAYADYAYGQAGAFSAIAPQRAISFTI